MPCFEAFLEKKDFAKAEEALVRGCEQSESLGFGFGISFCKQSFSTVKELQGDYVSALSYHKEYLAIKDDQQGSEVSSRLNSLKTKLALQEKDYQIELLKAARLRTEMDTTRRRRVIALIIGLLIAAALTLYALSYYRNRAKLAVQQRMVTDAQLKVLQSQMNPHFIYNAMSGIQNYILKSEKIEAYNYLGKFAALLRIITKYSTNIYIELEEEIQLINTYLELEKLRFRDDFVYAVEVEESLMNRNLDIPSMMVQPAVENAMIHGLPGLSYQGILKVRFSEYSDGVRCEIRDNGRGREAAARIHKGGKTGGNGNHLSIASINTKRRLIFLRKMGYSSAKVQINDLYEDGQAVGTQVIIDVPIISKENLAT